MNAEINLTDEAFTKFNDFKTKNKLAAIILKIEKVDDKEKVICEKEFPKEGFKLDDLIKALPTDEGRFIYLEFENLKDDHHKEHYMMAILYCPTKAKVSKKMIYSTNYGSLNSRLLRNIYYEMVCDDPSELSKEHILKRVKKEKKI